VEKFLVHQAITRNRTFSDHYEVWPVTPTCEWKIAIWSGIFFTYIIQIL